MTSKYFKFLSFFLFHFIIAAGTVIADSPLTSTPFYKAYMDKEIVLKAEATKIMNKEIAEYLHSGSNPIDVKAAVINAMGWDADGKMNAMIYNTEIYNKQLTEGDIPGMSADELFVIGYLKALDDYNAPEDALPFLNAAQDKMNDSYTVSVIEALIKAQLAMVKDFCKAWKSTNKVFTNKNLNDDMREEAVKIIYDYMILYKKDCK